MPRSIDVYCIKLSSFTVWHSKYVCVALGHCRGIASVYSVRCLFPWKVLVELVFVKPLRVAFGKCLPAHN